MNVNQAGFKKYDSNYLQDVRLTFFRNDQVQPLASRNLLCI